MVVKYTIDLAGCIAEIQRGTSADWLCFVGFFSWRSLSNSYLINSSRFFFGTERFIVVFTKARDCALT